MILFQGTIDLVLQYFSNLHISIAYHHIIFTWMPNLPCKRNLESIIFHSICSKYCSMLLIHWLCSNEPDPTRQPSQLGIGCFLLDQVRQFMIV